MAERALTIKTNEVKRENSTPQIRRAEHSLSKSSPVDHILFLQRTIGNQAVTKLISSGALQTKLRIGQYGDIYEQEADRVAEQVMRMPEPTAVSEKTSNNPVQRASPKCTERRQKEEEEVLQPKEVLGSAPEITPALEADINAVRDGGQPLPESARAFFEPRFGYDFSNVRVHTDAKAAEATRGVNALAYTAGQNIVFGEGQYAPETTAGRLLLAHELTYNVQQSKPNPGVPAIQRQEVGARGPVPLRGTGGSVPTEGPWYLRTHPTLGPVWYNRYTNNYYTHPPTPKSLTVLDWGENWNGYNVFGGLLRIGEIDASTVRDMVDRIKQQIRTVPDADCIDDLTIVGHGTSGSISVGDGVTSIQGRYIGKGLIDPQSPTYSAGIRGALSELTPLFCNTANVTLRGCNVGQGVEGAEFVRLLAELWRVSVRAPVGLTRAGGLWVEGVWQWGIPRGGGTPMPRIYAGQIKSIRQEWTLGDDEELIFDLLEQAKGWGVLNQVIQILTQEGQWADVEQELRDEDAARLNRLLGGKSSGAPLPAR